MKKLMICTAILLAGCGQKPSGDTAQQPAPAAAPDQAPQPAVAGAPYPARQQPPVAVVTQGAVRPVQRSAPGYASPVQGDSWGADEAPSYADGASQPVVSVYVDPPLEEPPPVRVGWAPPPMLVEDVPPPPSDDAVWTGGYWVWQGDWIWAHGRWAEPPRRDYLWANPYYEHRGDSVIFVDGYWRAPDRRFVPPPQNATIALAILAAGVLAGERPRGPEGVFVPPPPGSHRGLMVPAPVGTPPAVVTGAPPIIREGMHITVNNMASRNTTNITNIHNVTNVTVVAPASATATGQAVHATVSTRPHLAAALPPVVRALAPAPASTRAIPGYVSGRALAALPPPQIVRMQGPSVSMQRRAENLARAPEQGRAQAMPQPPAQPHPTAPGRIQDAPAVAAQPHGADSRHMPAPVPPAGQPHSLAQQHMPANMPPGQPRTYVQERTPVDMQAAHQRHPEPGRANEQAPLAVHSMVPQPAMTPQPEHHGHQLEQAGPAHAPVPPAAMAHRAEGPPAGPQREQSAHAAPAPEHHPMQVAALAKPAAPNLHPAEHVEGKPHPENGNAQKKQEEEKKREGGR